jgi:hypothetical protein
MKHAKVIDGWSKCQRQDVHNVCPSSKVIAVMKSKRKDGQVMQHAWEKE